MTRIKISSLIPISPDLAFFNRLAYPLTVSGYETITERQIILDIDQDLDSQMVSLIIGEMRQKILDSLVSGELYTPLGIVNNGPPA